MNDEITAARRKKRRKVQARRFFWFFVALVMVLGAVMIANTVTKTTFLDIGDFATVLLKGGGGYPAALDERAPIQAERMSMSFAVLTPKRLMTFSSSGAHLLDMEHSYVNPGLSTAGNRLLLYNVGSHELEIYNRSKFIAEFKTEYAIIDAKVAGDGTVAVLTKSDRYTCQVGVYRNGDYKKLFTWYGGEGFPQGVYINENGGDVAVAQMTTRDGILCTRITSINVSKASSDVDKAENFDVAFDGMLLAAWFEGKNLIAVTDKGAILLDSAGKEIARYAFPLSPILQVKQAEGGGLAVAFGDNLQPAVNRVVVLTSKLKEQCVIEGCGTVKDITLSSSRLYLLGDIAVSEYDLRGNLKRQLEVPRDALAVLELNKLLAILPDKVIRLK